MASTKKPQLPKSVLDMKFMKKTKERIEKELQNTKDHEDLYSKSITNEMRQASGNFITESSFIFCENLMEGRLSFKGMNPGIEKLMEAQNRGNENEGEMQKDISDEILANKMNKFNNNRKRHSSPSKYTTIKKKKR